jgi:hypothetical protein
MPVDREEVDRLRKRFMKLDKVRAYGPLLSHAGTDPLRTTLVPSSATSS